MVNRKVEKLTPEARIRWQYVQMYRQGGHTYAEVAQQAGVHATTIREWVAYYESEGFAGLNREIRPRNIYNLDAKRLRTAKRYTDQRSAERLESLARLADGRALQDVAAEAGVSVQAIMKSRRAWVKGAFPKMKCPNCGTIVKKTHFAFSHTMCTMCVHPEE